MDEPRAWIAQALADRQAAERFAADRGGGSRCHAIAKYQQTVEKSVKALVTALHEAGVLRVGVLARHEVERYIAALVRLPRASGNRSIQQRLHGLLDQETRAGIRALDTLAPQMPPRRNTEYPFRIDGEWVYPAAEGIFSAEEVQRFRSLAHRVMEGAERILSALRRGPR